MDGLIGIDVLGVCMRTKIAVQLFLVFFVLFFAACESPFGDDPGNGNGGDGGGDGNGTTDGSPENGAATDLAEIEFRSMIPVPGGTFLQEETDPGFGAESFDHTISDFEVAQYQVTYELWYAVRQWAEDNGYNFENPGQEGSDGTPGDAPTAAGRHQPVVRVSWRDAVVWLNAYSEMEELTPVYYTDAQHTDPIKDSAADDEVQTDAGSIDNPYVKWDADGYRLPTEGEWQYAASWRGENTLATDGTNLQAELDPYVQVGGTTWYFTPPTWPSGGNDAYDGSNENNEEVAWFDDSIPSFATQPVGQKEPNQLAIYDMSGNVEELVWDWKDNYPTGSQTDYRGPSAGPGGFAYRGVRGGRYNLGAFWLQIGERSRVEEPWSDGEDSFVPILFGFRPARTAGETSGESGSVFLIGDTGPAGGIVFYDKGDDNDGWRYLEVAPESTEEEFRVWGLDETDVGAPGTEIGTGLENTQAIVDEYDNLYEGLYAAYFANNLEHEGYNDWFLPSKDELNAMYERKGDIGISIGLYWSSSEYSEDEVWEQDFDTGEQYRVSKEVAGRVRAIRRF